MTFSLLAYDDATQSIGICSVTSSPAHGQRCLHFKKGVGIIATQGKTNRHHGVHGMELLSMGLCPEDCLTTTRAQDQNSQYRQIAIIDSHGRKAVFTGECNKRFKGHLIGDDFIAAGNYLTCMEVLNAIADGFRMASGEFADRLLAGARAGEVAGGEQGGSRSGFLVVIRPDQMQPWGADVDIRIDYAPDVIPAMAEAMIQYRRWEGERLHDQYSSLDGTLPVRSRRSST